MAEEPARPSTPPARETATPVGGSLTPEQVRRIEENRLRAKALREQQLAAQRKSGNGSSLHLTPNGFIAGQKRPHSAVGSTQRDGRVNGVVPNAATAVPAPSTIAADAAIRPAKKFEKYIEYDFSRMTDTKGGFLSAEDDPHNRALHAGGPRGEEEQRPAHMTEREWERHQLLKKLRAAKTGPFEPAVSALDAAYKEKEGRGAEIRRCGECKSLDIDWVWEEVFSVRVCGKCKDQFPEKYSLLTKTEVREDYLLTEPELKDSTLLPHLSRPNPHKQTYSHMQLYLRCQVEAYAFSSARWGSAEALDAEHDRRDVERKRRKEKKFAARLGELRRRTRVEAWKRSRVKGIAGSGGGGGGEDGGGGGRQAQFGDRVGDAGAHVHEWGRAVEDPETGMSVKTCIGCKMEVEELEF